MKDRFKFLFLCLLVFAVSCTKYHGDKINPVDKNFLVQASASNTSEIQAGMLAASKGNSAGVKAFGNLMVQEHRIAQADLKVTGSNVGIAVRDTMDAQHVTLLQQLTALSGRAFDSVYMKSQVNDHEKAASLFDTEINKGSHIFVRSYSSNYFPKITMHLEMADSIATAMKFK